MSLQLSTALRNALLDSLESTAGTSAILQIRSGDAPATCATASSGTRLASLTLPSDWMAAAASGSKSKSGTWADLTADATGTAGHFRIFKSDGTTCVMQGSVGTSSADMIVSTTSITAGDSFTVDTFTLTAPGA